MLSRLFGRLGLIVVLAATGATCKSDPTAVGTGTPTAVQAALASINVAIGSSGTITASVVDVRQTPLEASIAFTSCDAGIATVTVDTSYHAVPATSARAVVTSIASGTTCVVVSSPGVPPDTVTVNVVKAAPSIATSRNVTTGPPGQTLTDAATLAGGFGTLSGTITFKLYDSTQAKCAASPRYTQVVTITGAGTYSTSPVFTTDKLGTWRWTAAYSGNANNATAATACDDEQVAIKAVTTLATTANPTNSVGRATLNDNAVLGGGSTPKGSILFQLYSPSQATCGLARFSTTTTVSGNGSYATATGFKPDTAGTWHWTATYSGDTLNTTSNTLCNAEPVVVTTATTTLTTSADPVSTTEGNRLSDNAVLGGGSVPSGRIIFKLYDPDQAACTGTPRLTDTATVNGAGLYSTSHVVTANKVGTWRWTATYSGDGVNVGSSTACNDEQVTVAALPPGGGTGTGSGVGPAPVSLGTAANYVILAKSGISNVPTSAITGNLGLSPAAASAITGFTLTLPPGGAFSTSAQVTGNVYAADYAAPTPTDLTTAVNDMQTAYVDAAGRSTPDYTELAGGNIGGLTLPPGLYKWSNTVLIPTDVALSGGANDTWIFQIAGGITQSSAAKVLLSGGALAQNVVWQATGVVDIGTTARWEGRILSLTSITVHTGATVNGRLLAQTAVTLAGNTIVQK